VGNPVREDILAIAEPAIRYKNHTDGLNVLVIGGSLGAKIFNDLLPEVFAKVRNVAQITHQVGRSGMDEVKINYAKLCTQNNTSGMGIRINVVDFIDDMAALYTASDLIICRAGALTVSEVCAAGIAAIFVPYPNAVDDHQRHNAEPLVKLGAAIMIIQSELTVDKLASMINGLTREDCIRMSELAKTMAIPDSTSRIYNVILRLL
jgi:UDP-N-acetylglucosamine--N-acetylmuramyl-(pentapeptide) pyrophosphoryl-undecaprenol N-acetylglucosamine transferase